MPTVGEEAPLPEDSGETLGLDVGGHPEGGEPAAPDMVLVRRAVADEYRTTLMPSVFLAIGFLYLLASWMAIWLMSGALQWAFLVGALAIGGTLMATGAMARQRPMPRRWAYPATAAAALALAAINLLYIWVQGKPALTFDLVFLLLGLALLLPAPRVVAGIVVAVISAWIVVMVDLAGSVDTIIAILTTAPLIFLVSFVRTRNLRGVHAHRLDAQRRAGAASIAEDRFRRLVEAAPDGILIIDSNGCIDLANPQAQEMFGYSAAQLVGKPVNELVPHGLDAADPSDDPTPDKDRNMTAVRHDGTEFPIEIRLKPLDGDHGPAVIAVLRDITARLASEAADRALFEKDREVEQLKELNRFRTQLLNTAAHEINTPLTPLRLQVHMLTSGRMGDLNPEQERALGVLKRNVERLSTLTSDLLDVARLESGHLKVEPRPVLAAEMIEEAVGSFDDVAKECDISLTWDADSALLVDADPDRVAQVLLNLVGNAIKFTPAQGFVHVAAERASAAAAGAGPKASATGDVIRFTVEDSGVGLEDDQIARLFQPFTQVQEGEDQGPGGTGLGLYIARGLVESHGGVLGVSSEGRGRGSTFHFTLPATSAAGTARKKDEEEREGEDVDAQQRPRAASSQPANRARPERLAGNEELAARLRELI